MGSSPLDRVPGSRKASLRAPPLAVARSRGERPLPKRRQPHAQAKFACRSTTPVTLALPRIHLALPTNRLGALSRLQLQLAPPQSSPHSASARTRRAISNQSLAATHTAERRTPPSDAHRRATHTAERRTPPSDAHRRATRTAERRAPPSDAHRRATRTAERRAPPSDATPSPRYDVRGGGSQAFFDESARSVWRVAPSPDDLRVRNRT